MKFQIGLYKLGELYVAIYLSFPDKEFRISALFFYIIIQW